MRIIECTYEQHAAAILAIVNDAILNTTALYEYAPRKADSMLDWFREKDAGRFPVIGAEDDSGRLLGFCSYGTFRARPAYKYTVEHSVYVQRQQRRKGVGRTLMEHLIRVARQQQYHVMIGGIDTANQASIILHEHLGFTHAGTVRQVGFKFGRWLDLAFYQLLLETPLDPRDG